MGIFRTIGEARFYSSPNQATGILLNDAQTRTLADTIDVSTIFSKINIDSLVDVNELTQLLSKRNIEVRRVSERVHLHEAQHQIISCKRYPLRQMLPAENKELGVFIAESFPFPRKIRNIVNGILDLMSDSPKWMAVQLRIEDELVLFRPDGNAGFEAHVRNQLDQVLAIVSAHPGTHAVYIASGIREHKFASVVKAIHETFPHLKLTMKTDILAGSPMLWEELQSLCLEEQALVDWLVCINAPFFAGPHSSSFTYLAGYMRHYRGLDGAATHLWPEYQPYWDLWFPRLSL
ncbi:O-fucosyltransferase family protein [Paenibacillus sp. y28]|uniref:O-fucosyltransferase family protein n=1 Tax=Paenibacillus sp. y28 TaxID=3129110 RepID=UPI00301896A0